MNWRRKPTIYARSPKKKEDDPDPDRIKGQGEGETGDEKKKGIGEGTPELTPPSEDDDDESTNGSVEEVSFGITSRDSLFNSSQANMIVGRVVRTSASGSIQVRLEGNYLIPNDSQLYVVTPAGDSDYARVTDTEVGELIIAMPNSASQLRTGDPIQIGVTIPGP